MKYRGCFPAGAGCQTEAQDVMKRTGFASAPLWACVCVLLCGCGAGTSEPAPAPPAAEAAAAPASVTRQSVAVQAAPFPLPVIKLTGSPEQMGTAHGRRLGEIIRNLHHDYLNAYFSNPGRRMMAMAAAAAFEQRVSPPHLAEVNALAGESGVEARQMLLAQCFLDLSPMPACSTVTLPADASPDGVARFGRNLDFPGFDIADKATVVMLYRPADGRNAFAAVGWPGMCGVLSGMNEHGLALANMEVTRGMRLPSAMPYILLYRTVLERCATVDEAVELLRSTPRQTANNLMLMDAAGGRAVVEITPDAVHVRRPDAGQALISTNHQRGGQSWDSPGRCRRYDSLLNASKTQYGHIDVSALEAMLANASQGKMTLQSMVFEPGNRVLYLSAGPNAARGTFHRLDLKPLFVGATPVSPAAP